MTSSGYRIYYGALEQANHFVRPAIERAAPGARIDLVRLGRYRAGAPRTAISAIHEWKDPDILVTAIGGGGGGGAGQIEAPLLTIEFSTAAFTKDHELQRFDNYIPLMLGEFVAVKISPTNKRAGDHGGDSNYNYLKPLALVEQRIKTTPYHFEWRVDKGMSRVVLDRAYLSCPPRITEFEGLVAACVRRHAGGDGGEGWTRRVCEESADRVRWRERLRAEPLEDATVLASKRTLYRNGALELKINRMGHAMDPERGMLCYYGVLTSPVTTVFVFDAAKKTWYDGATQSGLVARHVEDSGLAAPYDYALCFALGTKIDGRLRGALDQVREGQTEVDIGGFVDANYDELPKALKTIFSFSDRLELRDPAGRTMVAFTYRRRSPRRTPGTYPPSPLKRAGITEDDVTYLIVHDVLKQNGLEIVAVSYPAAQGDRVMLIEKSTGRTQKRDYLDLVFLTRANINLHENKGMFAQAGVGRDVDKLKRYKAPDRRQVVDDFIDRYYDGQLPKDDVKKRCIRIGVGFVYDGAFALSKAQFLDDLDYFVYIKSSMEWSLWQCGDDLGFSVFKGTARLPPTYVVAGGARLPPDSAQAAP